MICTLKYYERFLVNNLQIMIYSKLKEINKLVKGYYLRKIVKFFHYNPNNFLFLLNYKQKQKVNLKYRRRRATKRFIYILILVKMLKIFNINVTFK